MKRIIFLLTISLISFHLLSQDIVYYCSRTLPSGPWQVYKKNLTTNVITTITNNSNYNYWWVELSPDHSKLVMTRSPYTSLPDQFNYVDCEITTSNPDGSNEQIIIADNQYAWSVFGNPHWHPTSNRLIVVAQMGASSSPFYIYTVDAQGNNPQQLTTTWSTDANWSPIGDKITFIGLGTNAPIPLNFEVFIANYNYSSNQVSNIIQLTNDTTRNHDPCFSPDGSKIAFSASDANIYNADIVCIDTNGLNRTSLLDDTGVHGGPMNWGTDGKIYHHSIYLFVTDYTANAFNTNTNNYETLFASSLYGYISPFYANLNITSLKKESSSENKLHIYPNPATSEINILLPQQSEKYEIEIFSSLGVRLLKTAQTTKIDISDYEKGVYLLNVNQNNINYSTKWIK